MNKLQTLSLFSLLALSGSMFGMEGEASGENKKSILVEAENHISAALKQQVCKNAQSFPQL